LVDADTRGLRLQIDPSITSLLSRDDPQRQLQQRLRREFGDNEPLIVAVQIEPVFSAESLRVVEQLASAYAALPGVSRVVPLASLPDVVSDGEEIDLRSFTVQARTNPERIAGFPAHVADNPLYRHTVVSADGRKLAFALLMDGADERAYIDTDYPALIRARTR